MKVEPGVESGLLYLNPFPWLLDTTAPICCSYTLINTGILKHINDQGYDAVAEQPSHGWLPLTCSGFLAVSQLVALRLIGVYLGKESRTFFCWVSELNRFNEVFSEHQSQLKRLGHLWLGTATAGTGTTAPFKTANSYMSLTALWNHTQSLAVFPFVLQILDSMKWATVKSSAQKWDAAEDELTKADLRCLG